MTNSASQKAYTTGKAAEICMCSLFTIIRCCDKGILPSYKVSESTHRRIRADKLYFFMKEQGIPTDNFPKSDIPKKSLENCTQTKE